MKRALAREVGVVRCRKAGAFHAHRAGTAARRACWSRVGVLAAVALLAGCTAIETQTPRPYPCEADADCRGGWVCGLEKTCHAPEAGAWKCSPDAGSAACFGWYCGLEGVCHAPEAAAYKCDPDAGSAACFGWHCGLEGVCYPLDAGVSHPCIYEQEQALARSDCDEGWRCGLEQRCHQVGNAQAWGCFGDHDCEGAWRCAATGLCVDPAPERPVPSAQPVTVERLAPALFDALPDLVAAGQVPTGLGHGSGQQGSVTVVHGARVSHVLYSSSGLQAVPSSWAAELADAGRGDALSLHAQATLPFTPSALVEVQDGTGQQTWLLSGGTAWRLGWSLDGTSTLDAVDAGAALEGLIPYGAGALAREGSRLYALRPDGSVTAPLDLGANIVTGHFGALGFAGAKAMVFTPSTFWEVTDAADGGLDGVPHDLVDLDGGAFVFSGGVIWPSSMGLQLVSGNVGVNFNRDNFSSAYLAGLSCTLCPPGLLPVAPSYCQNDAGVIAIGNQACSMVTALMAVGPPRVWSTQGAATWADAYGHVALGDTPLESVAYRRLSLPSLYEVGSTLAVGSGFSVLTGERNPVLYTARPGQGWAGVAGEAVGFFNVEVRNAPSWAVLGQRQVVDLAQGPAGTPWLSPTLSNAAEQFSGVDAPVMGCFSRLPDGGGLLATTSGDLVATAGVGASPPPAVARLAPFPSLALSSLALFPGDPDAGTLVRGYALSSAGVAYLEAFTERAWSGVTVDVPPGDWLELLSDEAAVRVAYSNGRLVTLPSRLDTSELLPAVATDFATYAGTDFALTPGGLYRSTPNPDGGALATWVAVPLPPATTQPGYSNDFTGGHLLGGRNGVYLVTPQDTAYAVRFDGGG